MKFLGFLLLVGVIGVAAYVGCGPRGQVAVDEITKRLDKALGELNVKRKSIENKQNQLQASLDELKADKYRAEARLDLLKEKQEKAKAAHEAAKAQGEQVIALMKEVGESGGEITRNGKTYSAEEVGRTAERVIADIKNMEAKYKATVDGYNALSKSVEFLRAQESQAVKLMDELKHKISLIDDQKIAVDAVRDTRVSAGGNTSISGDLDKLSKEIEDLGVEIDAALRLETDKMNELTSRSSDADDLLTEPANLESTQKMLEDLLK